MSENRYLLVNSAVLPPVFEGVILAKELLAGGKVTSAAAAAKAAGISRSAFYKYKDFVFKYSAVRGNTLSINALLSDRAGVFSALTAALYDSGANIITVTQGLPENGTANVSLTLSIGDISPEELKKRLLSVDGVISIKTVDGGKQ
ncbi:MAG: ACT domain-containing protein [Acutalibacteraceae bacterium]